MKDPGPHLQTPNRYQDARLLGYLTQQQTLGLTDSATATSAAENHTT